MARRKNANSGIEKGKKNFSRGAKEKHIRKSFIIAYEDKTSAPTYFEMIIKNLEKNKKIAPSLVVAKHSHTHPTGVLKDLKQSRYNDYDYKWIVIDRDKEIEGGGHSKDDFNNAIQQAKKLKVDVAYSNDCFELWYLLHFNYVNTAQSRTDLVDKLINKLKQSSNNFTDLTQKNIKRGAHIQKIFNFLIDKQQTAINNAKTLLESYGEDHNPEQDNPSTTIFKLVELLNNESKNK
jgi:hypothetical protein